MSVFPEHGTLRLDNPECLVNTASFSMYFCQDYIFSEYIICLGSLPTF